MWRVNGEARNGSWRGSFAKHIPVLARQNRNRYAPAMPRFPLLALLCAGALLAAPSSRADDDLKSQFIQLNVVDVAEVK
jgi:hypothetical protein